MSRFHLSPIVVRKQRIESRIVIFSFFARFWFYFIRCPALLHSFPTIVRECFRKFLCCSRSSVGISWKDDKLRRYFYLLRVILTFSNCQLNNVTTSPFTSSGESHRHHARQTVPDHSNPLRIYTQRGSVTLSRCPFCVCCSWTRLGGDLVYCREMMTNQ